MYHLKMLERILTTVAQIVIFQSLASCDSAQCDKMDEHFRATLATAIANWSMLVGF